jgi:hypothetical protein
MEMSHLCDQYKVIILMEQLWDLIGTTSCSCASESEEGGSDPLWAKREGGTLFSGNRVK